MTGYEVPSLATERLQLRAFTRDDLTAATAMWADAEVVRFIGGQPRTRAQVWDSLQRSFGSWHLLGYGYWAITDRQTGAYLGELGFRDALRPLTPSIEGVPEAGWALARKAWGKGIASEALGAILRWADATLNDERTVCIIEPEHAASIRVATRSGYVAFAESALDGVPITLFERNARAAS